MRSAKLVRSTIEELRKRINVAEKAKKEYMEYLDNLHEKYEKSRISYSDYLKRLYEKKDGKSLQEWISYLGDYIRYCEKSLEGSREKFVVPKSTLRDSIRKLRERLRKPKRDIVKNEPILLRKKIDKFREPRKDPFKGKQTIIFFSLIVVILAFLFTIYIRPEFVGFAIQEQTPEAISETNFTINTTQFPAVIGQPVRWKKHIFLDAPANLTVI